MGAFSVNECFRIGEFIDKDPANAEKNVVVDATIYYKATNTDYRQNIFEGKLSDIPAYFRDMNVTKMEDLGDMLYFKVSCSIETH